MEHVIGIFIYLSMFVGFGYFGHLVKKDNEKKVRIKRQQMKDDHKDYLASDWWRKRKNVFFNKFGRSCAVCSSLTDTDLHHKNYGRLHAELDQDLVPLCRTHHDAFHRTGRRVKDTDVWIVEEREKIMTQL